MVYARESCGFKDIGATMGENCVVTNNTIVVIYIYIVKNTHFDEMKKKIATLSFLNF